MGAGGTEAYPLPLREAEQPAAAIALGGERSRQVLSAPGADLDLRGDQLTGERLRQHRVSRGRRPQLLEAGHQAELLRVEQRELLLDPDGAVGRVLERLSRAVKIEIHGTVAQVR